MRRTNNKDDAGPRKRLKLILVNLISPNHLVRYQAPLAVNLLKNFIVSRSQVDVEVIDMQQVFVGMRKDNPADTESALLETTSLISKKIYEASKNSSVIVGLSMKWNTLSLARTIISEIKMWIRPDNILFVLGNIGATYGYQTVLKQAPFTDVLAVIGEGEDALLKIIETANSNLSELVNLERYKSIPNVAFNCSGNICLETLERVDLDNYPPLDLKPDEIYDPEWKVHAIETSRGCPWRRCTFCSIGSQFGKKPNNRAGDAQWKAFPMESIMAAISRLVAQGVRVIDIKDSDFIGPMGAGADEQEFSNTLDRVRHFASGVIRINKELRQKKEQPLIINHISVRVDTVFKVGEHDWNLKRQEMYRLLKKAGLKGIYLGIESGSPTQLRRYAKGTSVEENKKAISILRELGFELEVGFIFFDYPANLAELKQNLAFIEETRLFETDSRIFGSFRVQKGSAYEVLARNAGLLGPETTDSLSFECTFRDKDVAEIESIFEKWEEATRRLIRLLTKGDRLRYYELDYRFIKSLVYAYDEFSRQEVVNLAKQYAEQRSRMFEESRESVSARRADCADFGLFEEYLERTVAANSQFVPSIKALFPREVIATNSAKHEGTSRLDALQADSIE